MPNRRLTYVDSDGRKTLVEIPESSPDSDAVYGLVIGPPSLESLGLPIELEVALHNELFVRGIYTFEDAKRHRMDIIAALQHALNLDVNRILEIYYG